MQTPRFLGFFLTFFQQQSTKLELDAFEGLLGIPALASAAALGKFK
jgi:hypothetical protein